MSMYVPQSVLVFVCLFVRFEIFDKRFFIFYIFIFYLFKKKRDTLKLFIVFLFLLFLMMANNFFS